MGGAPGRLDVEREPAPVGDAEALLGRLGDDRRVGRPALEQRLGADARRLLVDDGGHDYVAPQLAPPALGARARNCSEARLHVVGAAAVQSPAFDARRQPAVRLEQADRVEVPVQDQRAAAAGSPRDTDHVRPPGRDLVDVDLEAGALEPVRKHGRDDRLAAARWDECGLTESMATSCAASSVSMMLGRPNWEGGGGWW